MNGIDCFFEGLQLITRPGLRKYVIVPLLINMVVMAGFLAWGISSYDDWMASVQNTLPEWLSFLSWVIGILGVIVGVAILLYGFTIVGNIIASPFNAILSVKVEELLTGQKLTSETPLHLVIGRSIAREFSKLFYYLPRLAGLVILTLIPGLNTLSPFLWVFFGAWMMAIQYVDYAADNNELSFPALRDRLGASRLQAVLFGLMAYFLVAIPVVNLIVIPAAVAGGTVFWVHHLRPRAGGNV
ncbi:MAG: sulfate transporter CysZ [Pseudomonadales bacterium]|nr:sulfate transporter CysZ [Pseudomonadales bacterium]